MSQIKQCFMCFRPAAKVCPCNPNTFYCFQHMEQHIISTSYIHNPRPFSHPIWPSDLSKFQQIQTHLKLNLSHKINLILQKRQEKINPLLQKIKEIEQDFDADILKVTREQNQKIEELKEMISNQGVKLLNENQRLLMILMRGQESLESALQRIYQIGVIEQENKKEINQEEKLSDVILFNFFTAHDNEVSSVVFSKYSDYIASASFDNSIRVWDISNGQCQKTIKPNSGCISTIAFSTNGQLLACGSFQKVTLYRVYDWILIKNLTGHSEFVESLAFSTDGTYLASGSTDRNVCLWRVCNGDLVNTFTGHLNTVSSLTFSLEGDYLVSGSFDSTIGVWEVQNSRQIKSLTGHSAQVSCIVFSGDGKYLASGSYDQTIYLWSSSNWERSKTFTGHSGRVNTIVFLERGYLASGSQDCTIGLWRVSTGQLVKILIQHTERVRSVTVSGNGEYLASASSDHTICLWLLVY